MRFIPRSLRKFYVFLLIYATPITTRTRTITKLLHRRKANHFSPSHCSPHGKHKLTIFTRAVVLAASKAALEPMKTHVPNNPPPKPIQYIGIKAFDKAVDCLGQSHSVTNKVNTRYKPIGRVAPYKICEFKKIPVTSIKTITPALIIALEQRGFLPCGYSHVD